MTRWAPDEPRACASVLATTKSTPERPETIMLLIALPPAPPIPHTTMRGFISFSWGAFRLIGIPCLSHCSLAAASPLHGLARQGPILRQHDHLRLSRGRRYVKLETSPLSLMPG